MNARFLEKFKNHITRHISIKSLQKKLFLLCMVNILVVCIIEFVYQWYAFNVYDELLYNTTTKVSRNSATHVEKEIENIKTVSFNIMADRTIQDYLIQISNEQEKFEQYKITNQLMNRLNTYISNINYVMCITYIGTNGDQETQGPRQKSLKDGFKEQVYAEAAGQNGQGVLLSSPDTDGTVLLARLIRKIDHMDFSPLGVVVIRLDLKALISDNEQYQSNSSENILIIKDGRVICSLDGKYTEISPLVNQPGENRYEIQTLGGLKKFITYWTSPNTGWTYISSTPYEQIFQQERLLRASIIFIMGALICIMAFVSMRFSHHMVTPIKLLMKRIKEVEKGNFLGEPDKISGTDEIAQLRRSFETMTNDLNRLIIENYKNQITVKEFQYRALQAQINPHFLYNTLNSVNWLAKMNGQQEISTIVESLSKLLRNAIDENAQTISIGEELEILQSYAAIQKIRYEERLEIIVDVKPELLKYQIPRLALQPLVENSINYALDSINDVCRISVRIEEKDGRVQIHVHDNGLGISPELLARIRSGTYKGRENGIGLKNIKERIMIIFDNQATMDIESSREKGTTVFLEFPAREL